MVERGREVLEIKEKLYTGRGEKKRWISTEKGDRRFFHSLFTWIPRKVGETGQCLALMLAVISLMVSLKDGSVFICFSTLRRE